jgi:beta-glucanase (GH16 family)
MPINKSDGLNQLINVEKTTKMKTIKILFFASIQLLFSLVKTEAQQWGLVWSDEFTNANIDTANWVFETGAGNWGNNELENYTSRPENASIYNGNLIIVGKKELYQGSSFTSARLKSMDKQSWLYGKVEARIKIPKGKGLWPAFWMMGNNYETINWPACGEIDIMEHIDTDNVIYGTMHWDNNGAVGKGGSTVIDDASQYHIYSVEWDSIAIKWFVDGNQYWVGNYADNINSTGAFQKPFFIILNMAIGGSWPGNPDNTTVFPDTMFIDYVRVYQNQTTPASINNNIGTGNLFRIFPNPATKNITLCINSNKSKEYKIKISDITGNTCFQKNILTTGNENSAITLSLDNLKHGLYFFSVRDGEMASCLKLVKL